MIHLDTHVVVWLYSGLVERIPAAIRALLEAEELAVSPAVVLELQYLREIGRLRVTAAELMEDLRARIGLQVAEAPFATVVMAAVDLDWTRDPFDLLIAAQAIADHAVLVTADQEIRSHLAAAVWE